MRFFWSYYNVFLQRELREAARRESSSGEIADNADGVATARSWSA